jgi:hypothetical protein
MKASTRLSNSLVLVEYSKSIVSSSFRAESRYTRTESNDVSSARGMNVVHDPNGPEPAGCLGDD